MDNSPAEIGRRTFLGILATAAAFIAAWVVSARRTPAPPSGPTARFWRTVTTRD